MRPPQPVGAYTYQGTFYKGDATPKVPTTTPGPDDTEHTPEDVTETIPLVTNVHADKQSGRANDAAEISDEEAYAKLKAKRAVRRRK